MGFSLLLNSFLVPRSWNFGCSLSSGQFLTYLTFFGKFGFLHPFSAYFLVSANTEMLNYGWQITYRVQLRWRNFFFLWICQKQLKKIKVGEFRGISRKNGRKNLKKHVGGTSKSPPPGPLRVKLRLIFLPSQHSLQYIKCTTFDKVYNNE